MPPHRPLQLTCGNASGNSGHTRKALGQVLHKILEEVEEGSMEGLRIWLTQVLGAVVGLSSSEAYGIYSV